MPDLKISQLPAVTTTDLGQVFPAVQSGVTRQIALDDIAVVPVATIAALKALTGMADGQQVSVTNYYAGILGGGGPFYWDAASVLADNGGTVILPTGHVGVGRWIRVYDGAVMATFFGFVTGGATPAARLQAAIDAMPATGGFIDATNVTGSLTFEATVTLNKPVRIMFGAVNITLGTNQILVRASGAGISGLAKIDENNSPTRFAYSGTSDAIEIKHGTTATPIFGNVFENFEVSATGAAAASATAKGITSKGTRYNEFRNIEVFNFTAGAGMYFTGNGAVLQGFGASCEITNPALSTNKYGILVDAAGGSAFTAGHVYGGYSFGSTSGFDCASESWVLHGTDLGGTPCVKIRAGADDTALIATRYEAFASAIVIDSGVQGTQIIAPAFINTIGGGGTEVTDNGNNTNIIPGSGRVVSKLTDAKLRGLQTALAYQFKGVTASIAAGGFEDVKDLGGNNGTWIVGVQQADGGTAWRACAIVFNSGAALTVASITSNNVTVGSSGTSIRLTNTSGSPIELQWSILKFGGNAAYA